MIDGVSPGRRISREDCTVHMPTRQRSWDWPQHDTSAQDLPLTARLRGQRISPNWGWHSSCSSFSGLAESLQRPWPLIHVTGSTFWGDSALHTSHHSHCTTVGPRHQSLNPALLTGYPDSTPNLEHWEPLGRYWFSKLPEKSTVIPMEMGCWDLSVFKSSSKGRKNVGDVSFPATQLKGSTLSLINAQEVPIQLDHTECTPIRKLAWLISQVSLADGMHVVSVLCWRPLWQSA